MAILTLQSNSLKALLLLDVMRLNFKKEIQKYVPDSEKSKLRDTPWGQITYLDYKYKIEFEEEYDIINEHCKKYHIEWIASAWDLDSQAFLRRYDLPFHKVASAMLTHKELLESIASEKKYTFLSTGMSTLEEIDAAIDIFKSYDCPFELMHCTSTYPMPEEQANLKMIPFLQDRYQCKVGYSGHESGLVISAAAIALGATSIERHITLDRAMFGTDQAGSVEVMGFYKLVKYIRTVEKAMGSGVKQIYPQEEAAKSKLRNISNTVS